MEGFQRGLVHVIFVFLVHTQMLFDEEISTQMDPRIVCPFATSFVFKKMLYGCLAKMSGNKEHILNLLKEKNYTGTFVEVGTWTGDFAEALLKHTECKKLVCVDPYIFFNDFSYRDSINLKLHSDAEKYYQEAKGRLELVSGADRVEILRKTSMEAVHHFQEESLDFVYIDANHEYKYALEDILAWYPKIRSGGLLAGDDVFSTHIEDYNNNNNMLITFDKDSSTWGVFGVYPAVLEAQRKLGISFTIKGTQFYYENP